MKTITEKEYTYLLEAKNALEKVLSFSIKENNSLKINKSVFLNAFGILKSTIKGDSLNYISKLRKEWRK